MSTLRESLQIWEKKIEVTLNYCYHGRWTVKLKVITGVGIGFKDNILCMYHDKQLVLIPLFNIVTIKVIE